MTTQHRRGHDSAPQTCQPVWIKTHPLVSRCARMTPDPGKPGDGANRCTRTDCLFGIRRR